MHQIQTPTIIITKSVGSENESLELVEIEPPTKYEPPTKKHRILASLDSFANILNNVFENEEERRHIDDNKVRIMYRQMNCSQKRIKFGLAQETTVGRLAQYSTANA